MGSRSMSKPVRVTVLCEDKQHWVFGYRFLRQVGYSEREISPIYSQFEGGKVFVSARINDWVSTVRQHNKCLLVIIDADDVSVADRRKSLTDKLVNSISQMEPIAILVPKYEIETWVHYLDGEQGINENDKYSKFKGKEKLTIPAAKRFAKIVTGGEQAPEDCLPSLVAGIAEAKRVLPK